jgi:hypothetical protein
MMSDDQVLCIYLRSKGKYCIKIGYTYNLYEDGALIYAGRLYRTQEKIVKREGCN